jgi:hypothetical protein
LVHPFPSDFDPTGCNELEPRTLSRLIWMESNAPDTKTIIEVPDGLCRQADAEAAIGGRKLKDAPRKTRQKPGLADLMKRAQGMIDSGIPDLASNPERLKGFGRNARDRRHARSNDER